MKTLRVALVVSSLAIGSLTAAAPAYADAPTAAQREDAQRHFKRGLELFEEDNFRAALIEFQRAYQIAPSYQVLYNIGQVNFQLHDYAVALKSFEKYLSEGGTNIPPERRTEVEREVGKLRARVATIDIKTTDGAAVSIDDGPVATAPLAPMQISSGRHKIRVTMTGREPVEKSVELAGGDTLKLDMTLAPPAESKSDPAPLVATPIVNTERPSDSTKWIFWGLTGALAVGTGVTAIIASGGRSDAKTIRENGGSLTAYDDAQKKGSTFGTVADILGIATIASAGVAIYFTVSSSSSSSPTKAVTRPLRFGLSPTGASLAGTF